MVALIWFFSSTAAQANNTYFVCNDWQGKDVLTGEDSYADTLFVGRKTNTGYEIKNQYGDRTSLIYVGDYNNTGVKIYSSLHKVYKTTTAYAVYISSHLGDYDLEITQFRLINGNVTTLCKFD